MFILPSSLGDTPFRGPNVFGSVIRLAATPAPRLRSPARRSTATWRQSSPWSESDPNARYQSAGAGAWLEVLNKDAYGANSGPGAWRFHSRAKKGLCDGTGLQRVGPSQLSLVALASGGCVWMLWARESPRALPPRARQPPHTGCPPVLQFENLKRRRKTVFMMGAGRN